MISVKVKTYFKFVILINYYSTDLTIKRKVKKLFQMLQCLKNIHYFNGTCYLYNIKGTIIIMIEVMTYIHDNMIKNKSLECDMGYSLQ